MRLDDGSVVWWVWAPRSRAVSLVLGLGAAATEIAMHDEGGGYFSHQAATVAEGQRYAYRLDDGQAYPDPASRWQPDGVHQPSAFVPLESFAWSDAGWRGISRDALAIYELHVGTFTPAGTLDAAAARLPELAALGITAIELMPLAQFPGKRNWGYDGAYPCAVQHSYGGPRALQRFVDAAHRAGLAVILDVVYNHLGPEGNYLGKFGPYFTDRYHTPWGAALNFDGPDSDPVRQYFVDNACMWVRDCHADGLRLDAVQTIYDLGARHILAEIAAAVQQEATRQGRTVHVIAESNQNDVRLINPAARGGYELAGVWADDFHHAVHALLTGERDGYYADFGGPEQLAKSLATPFVFDGCYSRYRRRRHGSPAGDLERDRFVVCIQNHDQVGNRARGDRFATILPPAAQRLAAGLLLLSPCTPLLLMGEEYGETRPFPFFCSFGDAELIAAVRRGRREEFASRAFQWSGEIPDPQGAETFASAVLTWSWPDGSPQAQIRQLYHDLLWARRQWPALADRRHTTARAVQSGPSADGQPPDLLILERGQAPSIVACANLTAQDRPLPPAEIAGRPLVFSTESPQYGGGRTSDRAADRLLPYELLVFGVAAK